MKIRTHHHPVIHLNGKNKNEMQRKNETYIPINQNVVEYRDTKVQHRNSFQPIQNITNPQTLQNVAVQTSLKPRLVKE